MDSDKKDNANIALLDESIIVTPERYPTSEFTQFYIILKRALLFSRRDWVGIWKDCSLSQSRILWIYIRNVNPRLFMKYSIISNVSPKF